VQRYGAIEVDANDRVRRFLGFPTHVSEPLVPLMYGGVWIFEPRVLSFMDPGVFSITKHTGPELLRHDERLFGYQYCGYWRVLDTPDDLKAGRQELQTVRMRILGEVTSGPGA
jgi:NDP-sugar pyrophosphorylase family protein